MFKLGDKVIVKPFLNLVSAGKKGTVVRINDPRSIFYIIVGFTDDIKRSFSPNELELDKNYLVKNIIKDIL